MITDFSSVMFDYISLDRPIAFLRIFSTNIIVVISWIILKTICVAKKINNFDDMINFLTNIVNGKDIFCEQRNHINNLINNTSPLNCCEKFVDTMLTLHSNTKGEDI